MICSLSFSILFLIHHPYVRIVIPRLSGSLDYFTKKVAFKDRPSNRAQIIPINRKKKHRRCSVTPPRSSDIPPRDNEPDRIRWNNSSVPDVRRLIRGIRWNRGGGLQSNFSALWISFGCRDWIDIAAFGRRCWLSLAASKFAFSNWSWRSWLPFLLLLSSFCQDSF